MNVCMYVYIVYIHYIYIHSYKYFKHLKNSKYCVELYFVHESFIKQGKYIA
jgi:hypothetical protein